jgi:hypothetical protein
MRFAIVAAVLPMALALPGYLAERQTASVCSGTTGNAQCCATDVLGLADLNCANRKLNSHIVNTI